MPKEARTTAKPGATEWAAGRELVKAARARGDDLTGPDGLLKMITATVLQAALDEEMTEHLGREKHHATTRQDGNVRNGTRPKTVPVDSCQDARVAVVVDSSVDARLGVGLLTALALLVVRVNSSEVRAWICRWTAAGFRSV